MSYIVYITLAMQRKAMDQVRLKEHLKRQMKFIRNSCALYDAGDEDEAIRIATTIRILIHETKEPNSLFSFLGVRSTIQLSSSLRKYDYDKGNPSFFDGVSNFTTSGIVPNLTTSFPQSLDVESWWEEIVLISGPQSIHTRKSITLAAANKDGGAHVEKKLKPQFKELLEGIFVFAKNGEPMVELTDHHFVALRVFANELLNSKELQALCV